MNSITSAFVIAGMVLATQSSFASLCNDPIRPNLICHEMKNLRSHIMMLEAQRDLMQVDYSYIKTVADSLAQSVSSLQSRLPEEMENHTVALKDLSEQTAQLARLADNKNPNAFIVSNSLRDNCIECHRNEGGAGGKKWDDIFKQDWNKISQKCNTTGRNPYVCKQMYGMITNFSYILTAYMSSIENYDMTEKTSSEIARISKNLVDNNFAHDEDRVANIKEVNSRANEAVALAQKKDPAAFSKAYSVTESCMECHSTNNRNIQSSSLWFKVKK
ncbi:MAG: hypothetical protein BroJett040_19760 [Oligoflexia bacterium]|nr:MAG: hypothetical protein BroJett040_19760 [Oligoflexia bacterium]